jgi:hypothetical protein
VAVITLLIMIAANTAHAANWTGWHSERDAPAWGQMEPGRTTTYVPWQKPDGTTGRCAVYQWRGEPTLGRCE